MYKVVVPDRQVTSAGGLGLLKCLKFSIQECTGKNRSMRVESRNRNVMSLSEKYLELLSEASRKFNFIFLFNKANNSKTICACTGSTDL